MGVLDSEEADEYDEIDHDGDALDEEYGSSLLGAGATEEVQDMQKSVKYFSLFPYMLKPSQLLTQGFENNMKSWENLFKHMFNFGARSEWREGRRMISSHLHVENT